MGSFRQNHGRGCSPVTRPEPTARAASDALPPRSPERPATPPFTTRRGHGRRGHRRHPGDRGRLLVPRRDGRQQHGPGSGPWQRVRHGFSLGRHAGPGGRRWRGRRQRGGQQHGRRLHPRPPATRPGGRRLRHIVVLARARPRGKHGVVHQPGFPLGIPIVFRRAILLAIILGLCVRLPVPLQFPLTVQFQFVVLDRIRRPAERVGRRRFGGRRPAPLQFHHDDLRPSAAHAIHKHDYHELAGRDDADLAAPLVTGPRPRRGP